jgi:predicted RNA binding protein YcfA (HicA-like mRNA interferase family)
MPKLPVVSGLEVAKALSKIGYEIDHQTGSHLILRQKEYPDRRITVPMHKELAKGTLRAIIRKVDI